MVESCEVAQGPMQLLGWCASTAPPASTALPSRPPGAPDHGWGRAEEWPRPRPVPPPERLRRGWVTAPARPRSRRTRRLGRVTRPGARLRAARRAQPSHLTPAIMGPGRSGEPERHGLCPPSSAARGLQSTHTVPHTQRETQPSQFKRPKDLHEYRRVPNVHIVSCCLRLPVPCLQKEYSFVNASLDGSRQPLLRAETPEKRSEFAPICDIANFTSSLTRCGEQAYPS